MRLWLLLGVWSLVTGCAGMGAYRATCAQEKGATWHEVRSAHFRVRTDLNAGTAETTARELERLHAGLLRVWRSDAAPPGVIDAIVLRHHTELAEFTQWASELTTYTEQGPLLVLIGYSYAIGDDPPTRYIQAHELSHVLVRHVMPRQPRWLVEGLATWLETVHFLERTDEVVLYGLHGGLFYQAIGHGRLSVAELWAWDTQPPLSTGEMARHYASAWAWVYFLSTVHPERFADFQARLSRFEEPRAAWDAAFQNAGDLEGDLRMFLLNQQHRRKNPQPVPMPPVPSAVETRELSCAEVHALRATLFLHASDKPLVERLGHVAREVDRALTLDATQLDAARLRDRLVQDPARRLPLARELLRAHPESGPAWELLGRALRDTGAPLPEQERAFTRAAELSPEDAGVLDSLARFLVGRGELERGLAVAVRALQRVPRRASTLETRAEALFRLGNCEAGAAIRSLALDVLPARGEAPGSDPVESARESLRQRLAAHEQRCRAR